MAAGQDELKCGRAPRRNARAFDFDPALLGEVRALPGGSAESVYSFVLEAV